MKDAVTLVNERDEVVGALDKIEAHRGEGLLHRAVSVFLFRLHEGRVQLLVQQRSNQKIVGALQWANTCCGNVRPGETYEACADRRLREELGIEHSQLHPLVKFRYQVKCNDQFSENEIDQVFAGWYDGEVFENANEVLVAEWVAWGELLESTGTRLNRNWAPWFELMLRRPAVCSSIHQFLHN